jgi:hypothetical protein
MEDKEIVVAITAALLATFIVASATHHHAQMSCFNHHSSTMWPYGTLDRLGDLRCQTLLYLQSTRKRIDQPRHLNESDQLLVGDVGDVDLAKNGSR